MINCSEFSFSDIDKYSTIELGCPGMGNEELEEDQFKPMFDSCLNKLKGKPIALFGSYGWGSGGWMTSWESMCTNAGAILVSNSVICNEAPGEDDVSSCKAMGALLANK